ncbi:hypothetical protein FPOA_06550 [Fusarium poae]|uniref:Endonuclease/exonuclease/phosphatase domain-containing protein n=1 Tax=Fusarium poae TaxID=36050 RepID=A0A1B8AZV1_FUSPO|nr:hypothetical protein FPOA_06550 [Fusarium poae]
MSDMLQSFDEEHLDIGQDHQDFLNDDEVEEYTIPSEQLLKSLTIWSVNLKRSPKRVNHLEYAIYNKGINRPHVIACQDPCTSQVYRGLPGYNLWCSTEGVFTEDHYRWWLNKMKKVGEVSDSGAAPTPISPASNTNAVDMTGIAATDASDDICSPAPINANESETPMTDTAKEPELHKVCFYVHKSIPTTSWNVLVDRNTNRGLVATLVLLTASRKLAIHNVYNHMQRLDIQGLFDYIPTFRRQHHDNMLLGDFNLHHHDWSPRQLWRCENPASREFLTSTKGCCLVLKTTPGDITYSNSSDKSSRSSTLDLTFVDKRVSSTVRSCVTQKPAGFESDHGIIETQLERTVTLEERSRLDWDNVDQRTFEDQLAKLLPSQDHPTSTCEELDEFGYKIIEALQKTIEICVRKIKVRNSVHKMSEAEQELQALSVDIAKLSILDLTPDEEMKLRELKRLRTRKKREMWQLFTGDASATPGKTFNLAALGEQICQPIRPCQVPTLEHGGVSATSDDEKIALFKKVIFRRNDDPKFQESTRPSQE